MRDGEERRRLSFGSETSDTDRKTLKRNIICSHAGRRVKDDEEAAQLAEILQHTKPSLHKELVDQRRLDTDITLGRQTSQSFNRQTTFVGLFLITRCFPFVDFIFLPAWQRSAGACHAIPGRLSASRVFGGATFVMWSPQINTQSRRHERRGECREEEEVGREGRRVKKGAGWSSDQL